MANIIWTDELIEQLRGLWLEGKSHRECAAILGEGFTMNSVAGKVHRLKLIRDTIRTPVNQHSGVVKKKAKKERKPVVMKYPPKPAPVVTIALPVTGRVTLQDLEDHHCRYPIGDPTSEDFAFCGDDKIPGKAYCAGHSQLCYYVPTNAHRIRLPAGV